MNRQLTTFIACSAMALAACGDDAQLAGTNPYQPYEDENVTVIGGDEENPVLTGATEGGCLQLSEEECFPVERDSRYCKEDTGPADVIVVDGVVQEVVCYEDTDATDGPVTIVDSDSDGDIDVPQQDNGGVLIFDSSSDGVPIEGDITVDGNNVSVYGNGPDKSIINGNLLVTGNNARIRGVRVMGNLTIRFNTAAVVLCAVEGNLVVESNNSLVAETDISGNLVVSGNNSILVGNDVGGNFEHSGSGTVCDGNWSFDDTSEDKIAQEEERTEALTCG